LDSIYLMIFGLSLSWLDLSGIKIEIDSQVPLASGLGSSASYSVCLACFFLILSDKLQIGIKTKTLFDQSELELINKYAFCIEKLFHGKPSGIDNSVATFGNYILFEKGQIKEKLNSQSHLPVLIVNSCVPKQTKEQVLKVRELYNKHTNIVDGLMNVIDQIVEKFSQTLRESQNQLDETLEDLISLNQGALFSLQICSYELNKIINIAQAHGCKSKLTGAGGGGCCFVLLKQNTDVQSLVIDLEANKFKSFMTQLGCGGIRIENF
jgi:mevalonate kinase